MMTCERDDRGFSFVEVLIALTILLDGDGNAAASRGERPAPGAVARRGDRSAPTRPRCRRKTAEGSGARGGWRPSRAVVWRADRLHRAARSRADGRPGSRRPAQGFHRSHQHRLCRRRGMAVGAERRHGDRVGRRARERDGTGVSGGRPLRILRRDAGAHRGYARRGRRPRPLHGHGNCRRARTRRSESAVCTGPTRPASSIVVPVVQRIYYFDRANRRLMLYDGYQSDMPLIDNVVDVRFAYFADASPSSVSRPADGTSSCVYDAGSPPVPRLDDLGGAGLHQLTAAQMTDGPVCGAGPNAFRWRSAQDPAGARHAAARGRRRRRPRCRGAVPAAGTIVERVQLCPRLRGDVRCCPAQHDAGGLRALERQSREPRRSRGFIDPFSDTERGVAVVVALLMALLVGAIAAALVTLTTTETLISASYRHAQEASYGAEAALERALHDLATMPDWSPALAGRQATSHRASTTERWRRAHPMGGRSTSCGSPPSASARATCAMVRSSSGPTVPRGASSRTPPCARSSLRRRRHRGSTCRSTSWSGLQTTSPMATAIRRSTATGGSSSARWRSGPVGPGDRPRPASARTDDGGLESWLGETSVDR